MKAKDLRCEYQANPLGIDAARPRLSWTLQGNHGARDLHQVAYRVIVASTSTLLRENNGDLWDSGKVFSNAQIGIPYSGSTLKPGQACYWKVAVWSGAGRAGWSLPARWEVGRKSKWAALWISDGKKEPTTDADFYTEDPAPLYRKEFPVRSSVKRARLSITGLGYFEASVNGTRVGDHVLEPGWTKVDQRAFYSVYDVTKHLTLGKNCIGIMLGNGWFNPLPMRLFGAINLREHLTTGRPQVVAQLELEYRDGSKDSISTDLTWKVGKGAILRNNVYLGEVVDARKEQIGWDLPGFDDSGWTAPVLAERSVGPLVSQPQPPIRVSRQWPAVRMSEPKTGVYIYDCGVNFAGWVSLRLNVPTGTVVRLRYGELLHPDGSLNPMTSVAGQIKGNRAGTTESAGGPGSPEIAWQSDTFVSRGGQQTYTPHFTFHGFRFVEISGLPSPLPLEAVIAQSLNSDLDSVGNFECSNPLLTSIQQMCLRTFRSNIFSVQSDCPHRERLAYGGDIVATGEAMVSNFDMATFYGKAVQDWSDSTMPDGMFTDTAPYIGIQYCGLVWAMAHPFLLDLLYRNYGDQQIGEREFDAAARWLKLVDRQYPDGIVTEGLSDHESLTANPAAEMVTPLYYHCAELLLAQARRLGRSDDEIYFLRLSAKIKGEYSRRFINAETGKVGPGTQASQAFALATDVAPQATRTKILAYLLKEVQNSRGHLNTGILGTKFLLHILSREGLSDVAYEMVTKTEFPGWGWMLKNGATTLWEHWEFSDNTFSHNHPMFGSVSQWMMQWLGGIQPAPEAEGYDVILIKPQTPKGLDWVRSSYKSIRGLIVSNWTRQGTSLKFEITIPVNARATVTLPAKAGDQIREGGRRFRSPSRPTANGIELSLGSGEYSFEVQG
jgi:alpha-L-rhamnosidase